MRLRFIFVFAGLMAITQLWAGSDAKDQPQDKLSMMTKMFIDELNRGGFDPVKQAESRSRALALSRRQSLSEEVLPVRKGKNNGRIYAAPDTINGRAYVSAFITLDDNNDVSALESMGVKVQCRFDKGIITSMIPVDRLSDVAALSNVRRISVARVMQLTTNKARELTNVDDVITKSSNAVTVGLNTPYDGKGVLLGVIDAGIDYQHIAFKDKDGNSRIVGAYVFDGEKEHYYDASNISSATTDNKKQEHGTHTASIAGGSSVILDGDKVTVTDDHSNATYGGMAPGADLYLCGVYGDFDTHMANSFQAICKYADDHKMPVVISNSYGYHYGPHDGTYPFELTTIIKNNFYDGNPNHICIFSSGNEAFSLSTGEGGNHLLGTASNGNPLGTIIKPVESNYKGILSNVYARNTEISALGVTVYVLDNVSNEILMTCPMTKEGRVEGLEDFFIGELYVYFDYFTTSSKKKQLMLGVPGEPLVQNTDKHPNGCSLAIEVYPLEGTTDIDIFGGDFQYFIDGKSSSGLRPLEHDWKAGSDDMSVVEEATIPEVISVGAYVSKTSWVGYDNKTYIHNDVDKYITGEIAPFSSYATESQSPTGLFYPWITAPGSFLISAVNHYNEYTISDENVYRVNNNKTSPYAAMEGTSMACPTVAGIVALWLQAAKEVGLTLTTSDVKRIMKETAIRDAYVTEGPFKERFGNGKIDALAGIAKILEEGRNPWVKAIPAELTFEGALARLVKQTVNVRGMHLSSDITVTLTDESGIYSIDKTSIAASADGVDITVSWLPTEVGTSTATLTLSAEGVEDVKVKITGNATLVPKLEVTGLILKDGDLERGLIDGTDLRGALVIHNPDILAKNELLLVGLTDVEGQTTKTEPIKVAVEPDKTMTFDFGFGCLTAGHHYIVTATDMDGEAYYSSAELLCTTEGLGEVEDGNENIVAYEYWFDDDYANRHEENFVGNNAYVRASIDTEGLSLGRHQFNFRVKRADSFYSAVTTTSFFKLNQDGDNALEYWLDDDVDNLSTVPLTRLGEECEMELDLSDDARFPIGNHKLNMRVSTAGGLGSVCSADVMKSASGNITMLEYWFDGDLSNSHTLDVRSVETDNSAYIFAGDLDIRGISPGYHRLYYRARSSSGFTTTAVGMTSVLLKSRFGGNGEDATMAYYSIVLDGNQTVSSGSLEAKNDLSFVYFYDATQLPQESSHTLKFTFWSSYGTCVVENAPFRVKWGYVEGDANGDGKVDYADVEMTVSQILGKKPVGIKMDHADMNNDGKINIEDVTRIIGIITK